MAATETKENRVTSKDLAEMAKAGMAAIMKEAKDPTLLTNFLQTSAHNLNLSPTNKAALAVQAPGARNVMSYDGVKYQGHNSVRKGEKAAAHLITPKKNDKGKLYFVAAPVFSQDQLAKPTAQLTADDLSRAVGGEPDKMTAGLTAAMDEIAAATGDRPDIGDLNADVPAQTAALILQYRHDAADPALESQVAAGLMKPDRGMPTGEFIRSCNSRQTALLAGDELAKIGNAVISRVAEIQKENPEVTLTAALEAPGEHGNLLADIALEVAGKAEPKEPSQYQVKAPKAKTQAKAPQAKKPRARAAKPKQKKPQQAER